jgi:hypothetical protein
MIRSQESRRGRVDIAIAVTLEDPVRGKQAQHPVERVLVSADPARQLGHWNRLIVNVVGDAKLCNHMKTASGYEGIGESPNQLVWPNGGGLAALDVSFGCA